MRLTVKERVLLHLLESSRPQEALEGPLAITQEGIARGAWFSQRHFVQYVRPLMRDELVLEGRAHVGGIRQRRKVYELTPKGKTAALRLRDRLKPEVVRVRDDGGVREATVEEILRESKGQVALTEIVRLVVQDGIYDPHAVRASSDTRLVEMLADAPRPKRFIGRQSELEQLAQRGEGPRMFVVQGVAGIGKSSLAAEVCQRLRGARNLFWHQVRPWDTFASLLTDFAQFLFLLGRPALRSALARGDLHNAVDILRRDLPGSTAFLVFDDVHEAPATADPFFRLLKDVLVDVPDVQALLLSRGAVSFYDRRDVTLTGLVQEMDLGRLPEEDVEVYLDAEEASEAIRAMSRRLGGHPLLLELLLARQDLPTEGFEEANRFIEEEIYLRLTEPERRMIKLASMYQVPVPRDGYLVDDSLVGDVLSSLRRQSLILPRGRERWGIHDAIREFLTGFISDVELEELGQVAARNLRALGTQARESGDGLSCVAYLSNAVQMPVPHDERLALLESLGDAHLEIGGLEETLAAYKGAMGLTSDREVLARLHGKRAFALYNRDAVEPMVEIDKGLRVLGDRPSPEAGWLTLLRSRILNLTGQFEEARKEGKIGLDIFRRSGVIPGVTKALAWLAANDVAARDGSRSRVHRYVQGTMKTLAEVEDTQFMADAYLWIATALAWAFGEGQNAMRLLHRLEDLPQATGDYRTITTRSEVLALKGRVEFCLLADDAAAVSSLTEAVRAGRRIRDTLSASDVKGSLAVVRMFQGDLEIAHQLLHESIEELRAQRAPRGAIRGAFWEAICSLLQDDVRGFLQAASTVDDVHLKPGVEAEPLRVAILQGFRQLVEGDAPACRETVEAMFEDAGRYYPPLRTGSDGEGDWADGPVFGDLLTYIPHFFGGVALKAMGLEEEGQKGVTLAREVLKSTGYWGTRRLIDRIEGDLTNALRRAAEGELLPTRPRPSAE